MHKNIYQIQIQCSKAPGGWLHFFPVAHDARGDTEAWSSMSILQATQPDFLELWEAQEGEDLQTFEDAILRAMDENPNLSGTVGYGGNSGLHFTNDPYIEIYNKGLITVISSGGMDV